ncbi:Eukaryotic translation initiation factor 3 subunit G [Meloidogyne graminicola]|uniref:Eukaryotic translation initiation factor 3 subunit G n=1 Tax=Meloidogyne graminicola TaxID=189291 RepID=A0A8T0A2V6_9BILA|nr:Eukaryotic translation initiation factor 3 subunit G [Meloidogyne graminicola]
MIIKKRYMEGIVNRWKRYLNYHGMLNRMRLLLIRHYKIELWSDQDFCKNYLQLYESFRFFRSMANRDHKGDSIIDDINQQEEAYPLYRFFNVDYDLRDRLLYALEGTDWISKDDDEEELTAKSTSETTAKSVGVSSEEVIDGVKKRHNNNETVTARDEDSQKSMENNSITRDSTTPSESSSDTPGTSNQIDGEDNVFPVERIIGKRIFDGVVQYKIKWKGYDDPEDDTWEDIDNVHCTDLVKEYENEHKNDKVEHLSTKTKVKRGQKRKASDGLTNGFSSTKAVESPRQIPLVEKESYFLDEEDTTVDAILGSNTISEISWVDAVDQEHSLRETKRTEIMKDGLKIVTDFVENEENGVMKKSKVVTTYKVVTKKVPRVVAERKKWQKFGQSKDDGPGPNINTTYVGAEVEIQFLHNRFGETDELIMDEKGGQATKGMHCRLCKSDEHWSTHCPYKEHFKGYDDEDTTEKSAGTKPGGAPSQLSRGTYVPPSLRNVGPGGVRPSIGGTERPSDETTVRITNLPEDSDTLEDDLRSMFSKAGRIMRSYVAKDKITNKPKGFAFITFHSRSEAERAIQTFNGEKFEHLILKVEWTKPSTNNN